MLGELRSHLCKEVIDHLLKVLLGSFDVISLLRHEVESLGKLGEFLQSAEIYGAQSLNGILECGYPLGLFADLCHRLNRILNVVICCLVIFPELILVLVDLENDLVVL